MLPARFEQASFSLAEINNAKFTRPAVSSGMSVGSFPEQRLVIEPSKPSTASRAGGRGQLARFAVRMIRAIVTSLPLKHGISKMALAMSQHQRTFHSSEALNVFVFLLKRLLIFFSRYR